MKNSTLISIALLLVAAPALADTFNFTFTGSPASGSGQFTASPTIYGTSTPAFLVTAATGSATFNGQSIPITGIARLGAGFQGNDNILFFPGLSGGDDFFDGNGTAFLLGNGAIVDLYAIGGIYLTVPGQPALPETGVVTVTSVTPEPSSLALLATGCLAFAVKLRRRL